MEELYQIEDLVPIVKESDSTVYFVSHEDVQNPECLCIKVDFTNKEYYIDLFQRFLKFCRVEDVTEDELVYDFFRQKIYSGFSDEKLVHLVTDFTESMAKWKSLENKMKYGEI